MDQHGYVASEADHRDDQSQEAVLEATLGRRRRVERAANATQNVVRPKGAGGRARVGNNVELCMIVCNESRSSAASSYGPEKQKVHSGTVHRTATYWGDAHEANHGMASPTLISGANPTSCKPDGKASGT